MQFSDYNNEGITFEDLLEQQNNSCFWNGNCLPWQNKNQKKLYRELVDSYLSTGFKAVINKPKLIKHIKCRLNCIEGTLRRYCEGDGCVYISPAQQQDLRGKVKLFVKACEAMKLVNLDLLPDYLKEHCDDYADILNFFWCFMITLLIKIKAVKCDNNHGWCDVTDHL